MGTRLSASSNSPRTTTYDIKTPVDCRSVIDIERREEQRGSCDLKTVINAASDASILNDDGDDSAVSINGRCAECLTTEGHLLSQVSVGHDVLSSERRSCTDATSSSANHRNASSDGNSSTTALCSEVNDATVESTDKQRKESCGIIADGCALSSGINRTAGNDSVHGGSESSSDALLSDPLPRLATQQNKLDLDGLHSESADHGLKSPKLPVQVDELNQSLMKSSLKTTVESNDDGLVYFITGKSSAGCYASSAVSWMLRIVCCFHALR